jgi:hypothetical protein
MHAYSKKCETGVVVALKDARLILMTSEVPRQEAAHLIRCARRVLPAIKYFPAKAGTAAATIHHVNASGAIRDLLGSAHSDFLGSRN